MMRMIRANGLILVLTFTLSGGACLTKPDDLATTTPTPTVTPVVTPTTTPTPTPSPVASDTSAKELSITLPVLDAFFTADQAFAGELKNKLQLTDEQIDRLRTAAREETARLRENSTDAPGGTTAAAQARAVEELKAVIGEQKARQLTDFVYERWRNGSSGGTSTAAQAAITPAPNTAPNDTRIVVNAPAYRMDVFKNGELVKSYKVGIGYPEFPLPAGLRRASNIIFNPTWTPPDEPWVETPTSKVKIGEKVEAGSKLNPLGIAKIPIGLPSLIHGGKAPAKIGGFASHGCVGLTDRQLRDFLPLIAELGGVELSDAEIAKFLKNRAETKNIKLATPVPVELRYETIVVEDGKLHIYRDVYDRETNTEENLRAVLQASGASLDQLSADERTEVLEALDQMSRGPNGKPNETRAGSGTLAGSSANQSAKQIGKSKSKSGKVTRTVKGAKEVVIEMAALQGKGYPAPVDLNTGGAPAPSNAAPGKQPAARRKGR